MAVNITDYTAFLRSPVDIPIEALPDNAPAIASSLQIAQDVVNPVLNCASPDLYVLAVYNLAADYLINYAPDQNAQTFFRDMRKELRIFEPTVGVVASGADAGTSMGLQNPEQLARLTLGQLQNLKTFWGRRYLAIAQSYGTTLWGIS